jgi:hypothetical protein
MALNKAMSRRVNWEANSSGVK